MSSRALSFVLVVGGIACLTAAVLGSVLIGAGS